MSDVKKDESGMTLVDFWKVDYWDESFMMTQQASKAFYVKDLASKHWFVALHKKNKLMLMKRIWVILILLIPTHLKER